MRYLVLGSSSFTGAAFIVHLLDRECTVLGGNRSPGLDPILFSYRYQRVVSPDYFDFARLT